MTRLPLCRAGLLAGSMFLFACGREDVGVVRAPVRDAADDAGTLRASVATTPSVRFESRDGEVRAKASDHAVVARGSETRIDGVHGRLLTLGTTRAVRGTAELGRAGAPRSDSAGRLVRSMSANVTEQIVTTALGTEQSWRIASRPDGRGDLVVTVPVASGRYLGTDARGIRFEDAGGEVLYSHATFVDADGSRTDVPARFVDGSIVLRIASGTLDAARYPAVLDPSITPVITIAGVPGSDFPAYGDQRGAAASSFDGDNGIVVYLELGIPSSVTTLQSQRFDADGVPVGARIRIALGVSDVKPAIDCNPSECLVVYVAGGQLRGLRVGPTGAPIDASPTVIATIGSVGSITVDDDGAGRLVAWSDRGTAGGSSYSIRARRVSSTGALEGTAALALGTSAGTVKVDSASHGGITVVVWDEIVDPDGRIRGSRISQTGDLLDPTAVTLADATNQADRNPSIAIRDGEFVLAFQAQGTIWMSPIATDPALVPGARVSITSTAYYTSDLAIAGNGTSLELAHLNQAGSNSQGTIRSGSVPGALGTTSTVQSAQVLYELSSLDVVPMATGPLVISSSRRIGPDVECTNGFDVQAVRGTGPTRTLSRGASSARAPSAEYSNSQFVVGHVVDESWAGRIAAAVRLTANGTRLDEPRVVLATGTSVTSTTSYEAMAASYVGPQHAFVWRRRTELWTTVFGSATNQTVTLDTAAVPSVGLVRTATEFLGSTYAPIGGSSFMALPWSYSPGLNWTSITETTVTHRGQVFAAPNNLVVRSDGGRAVGWNATQLVVIQPSSTSPTTMTPLASTTVDDGGPGIAPGTTSTLIVRRNGVGGSATNVDGILTNYAGTSITKTWTIHAGSNLVGTPRVAFDGTYYDVFFVRDTTLYLLRVTQAGVVFDSAPIVVATGVVGGYGRTLAVATDRAGRVLVAYDWFDVTEGVRAMRIGVRVIDWSSSTSGATNGTACTSVLECASGNCVDGVCCDTTCGGGATNDCQACAASANGTLADGTCGPTTNVVVCRAAGGVCDVAETCSGTATTCPADAKVAVGTVCGAPSTQPCETAQMCNGTSNACPAKLPAQGSPVCRPADGICDAAEVCNGISTVCPPDAMAGTSVVCRDAAGPCDRAETCTGASRDCPGDTVLGTSAVCRPAASACDRPDTCDGSGIACPAFDAPSDVGTVCRASVGPCDVDESCDGSSFECPADLAGNAGTECRAQDGACDVAESCDGISTTCPADGFAAATTVCRASAGPCDVDETCTGGSRICPVVDSRKPAGTVCRASLGVCDRIEFCDGIATGCPANAFAAKGTVCRGAEGICDSAEACSGLSATCPLDRVRVDGSPCGDGLTCNGSETCSDGECVAGEALVCAEESPCLETTGACAVRTRPGGAPGCSVATAGQPSPAAPWLLGAVAVGLALLGLRRSRVRLAMIAAGAIALVAQGCVCGVGAVSCDGACVDVGYDETNCGACGVSCGAGQCVEGACVGVPTTGNPCADDAQCLDGNACDGVERCVGGRCREGTAVTCDDGLACTEDACDPELGSCVAVPTSLLCGTTP